jgi:hypothetical protein
MYCKILSKVIKEAKQNNYNSQITTAKINKHTMADFVTKLSNESWDTVFDFSDIEF